MRIYRDGKNTKIYIKNKFEKLFFVNLNKIIVFLNKKLKKR